MANEPARRVSRRGFLQFTGAGLGLLVLSACGSSAATPTAPPAPAATTAAGGQATSPAATAPAVVSKPFAGKELNLLGPNHHTSNVRDLWVPIFQEQTGAKVNYTEIGSGDVDAKYAVFVASQDATFDTFYTWETLSAKYGPALMEDLTGKVDKATLDSLVPAPVKAFTFLGKLYGLPFDSNLSIFMWNTELYKNAGLDPTAAPQSWQQFMDYSKKLTTGGKFATLFTFGDPNSGFVSFAQLFNTTGGQLLSDDLKKLQIDNEFGLATMAALQDAHVKSKIADPSGVTVSSSIEQGKIFRGGNMAHYFAFPNHYTLAQDPTQSQIVGKAATGIVPGIKLRSASINGFEGYTANKYSKNKDLALAWVKFVISPEVQKLVALKWGRPPALQATYDDPEVAKAAPQFAAAKEQGKYPAMRYGSPYYFDLGTVVNDWTLRVIKGEKEPQEAITAIQKDGQKVIDDYWAKVK
ncbi:MAG TPA: extracellular solute-binding protein [Thermomicrobiales bacterium]|nr:extracellular solute-binding protein [Thermomicrobiales bacterium]